MVLCVSCHCVTSDYADQFLDCNSVWIDVEAGYTKTWHILYPEKTQTEMFHEILRWDTGRVGKIQDGWEWAPSLCVCWVYIEWTTSSRWLTREEQGWSSSEQGACWSWARIPDASDHICGSQWPVINVTASYCAWSLQRKFWYLLFQSGGFYN